MLLPIVPGRGPAATCHDQPRTAYRRTTTPRLKRKRQAGCMPPGYYERPDEGVLALWRTGVEEW